MESFIRFFVWARAGAVRDRSVSGLERDGRALAIAFGVLTRRSLRRGARYEEARAGAERVKASDDNEYPPLFEMDKNGHRNI